VHEAFRKYETLRAQLRLERASWEAHWQDLADFLRPRAIRLTASDVNDGKKKHNNIIDNTGLRAARSLAAGLMAGVSSPSAPWFRLAPAVEYGGADEPGVERDWLDLVETVMRAVFASSNTYNALHTVYDDLGIFGTAACFIEDDFDTVIHHTPLMIGEYALATDHRRRVNGMIREFRMTVGQLVQAFGYDNCSTRVRHLYDSHNYIAYVDVVHVLMPRTDYDPNRAMFAGQMAYESVYYELGCNEDKFLRRSGYRTLRLLAPRWIVRGNDVYGESPGMDALGDVKQLQHEHMSKGEAIDYMIRPPLQVPTSYAGAAAARYPGGIMYVDSTGPENSIRSAYDVRMDLDALRNDIADIRERINGAFYRDLFLMISSDTRSNVTAYEIAERNTEKLLMLGPVLERVHNEVLGPLIDLTFDRIMEAKIVPPPPPSLRNKDLRVEFVSILAQAQKATGARSLDRLLQSVTMMANANPDALDKLDFDQAVDEYASMFAVRGNLVRSDEEVAAMRAERARAQKQQQLAEQARGAAEMAKMLSETDGARVRENLTAAQGGQAQAPDPATQALNQMLGQQ
jgi:hypothetical protein